MKLNTTLIVQQRHALALTYREIAAYVGTTAVRVRGLEQGEDSAFLTLCEAQRLADVLGVDLVHLLGPEEIETSQRGDTPAIDATIGALLATAGDDVSLATLAQATGNMLEDTRNATARVDQALRPLGMRIHQTRADSPVRIVADVNAITHEQTATLLRGMSARIDLSKADATLIHRIATDPPTAKSIQHSNAGRVQLGRLVNAGLVVNPKRQTEPLELTADVKYSLMLTHETAM